jgi:hypothetical protein
VFNLVSVSLIKHGQASFNTMEVAGLSLVPIYLDDKKGTAGGAGGADTERDANGDLLRCAPDTDTDYRAARQRLLAAAGPAASAPTAASPAPSASAAASGAFSGESRMTVTTTVRVESKSPADGSGSAAASSAAAVVESTSSSTVTVPHGAIPPALAFRSWPPSTTFSPTLELHRNGSDHVTAAHRARTDPLLVTLFELPRADLEAYFVREHRYRFVEVDVDEFTPVHHPDGSVDDLTDVRRNPLTELSAAPDPARQTVRAITCLAYNDVEYRAARFSSAEAYRDMIGRYYGGRLWRNDLNPVRSYLRLCMQVRTSLLAACGAQWVRR